MLHNDCIADCEGRKRIARRSADNSSVFCGLKLSHSQYYLMKEENSISENAVSLEVHQTEATNKREKRILGIATCIIGVVLLIAWGIVSVFMPSASEQIGTSSMITIDGNGIFLLICLVAIIAGAVLLLKSTSNK